MTDKRATTYTAEEIEAMAARYARSNGHADVAVMLYSLADQQEIIAEGKRQWDRVAALLGADGDNVDDVLSKVQRVSELICPTCNGNGMIGGPSYAQPDEGGVPCPDCSTSPQAVVAQPVSAPKIVLDVLSEVERAIAKFPTWPVDPLHAVGVVNEEYGELAKAVLQQVYEPHKNKPDDVRKEAIQAAAMAFRFIAGLDQYDWTPGKQYEQISLSEAPKREGE